MTDFKKLPTVNGAPVALADHMHPPAAGLVLWLDANQFVGAADSDPVATWVDMSGNNKHATQATSGKRPLYKTAILNGFPVVRFDGTDDVLSTPALGASAARTIIAVAKLTGGSGTPRLWGLGAVTASVYALSGDTAWGWYASSGFGLIPFGGNANNFTILTTVFASLSSLASYLNGTAGGSGDPNDGYADNEELNLGASIDGAGDYGTCDIAEVLVWNRALSSKERLDVENSLGVKYAIAAAQYQTGFASLIKWGTD